MQLIQLNAAIHKKHYYYCDAIMQRLSNVQCANKQENGVLLFRVAMPTSMIDDAKKQMSRNG